jgi:hypothetical protein
MLHAEETMVHADAVFIVKGDRFIFRKTLK